MGQQNSSLLFFFEVAKTGAMISRRLSGHGLDFSDFMILYFLSEASDGKMKRIDLANKLGITASGVTRMLLPLEKLHIIERDQDNDDARTRFTKLTPAGQELFQDALASMSMKIDDLVPKEIAPEIKKFTGIINKLNW